MGGHSVSSIRSGSFSPVQLLTRGWWWCGTEYEYVVHVLEA